MKIGNGTDVHRTLPNEKKLFELYTYIKGTEPEWL